VHELGTRTAKGREEIGETASVVVSLVCPTVRQVGRKELGISCEELLRAVQPKRLQIEEVPCVLLGRPMVIVPLRQNILTQRAGALFESCGRASEPFEKARKAIQRQPEVERALKPLLSRH
jgi:hypothetical protein